MNVTQCICRSSKGGSTELLGLLKYNLSYEQICNKPSVLEPINMLYKIFVKVCLRACTQIGNSVFLGMGNMFLVFVVPPEFGHKMLC